MTIQQAVTVLRIHNKWRRGECDQTIQQDPRQIGEAIDKAVEVMEAKLKRKAINKP